MFVCLTVENGSAHFELPEIARFKSVALVKCWSSTGKNEQRIIVLGDFVEYSITPSSLRNIVGIKSNHLLYADIKQRRTTCALNLVDNNFKTVSEPHQIILHFKTDK